MQMKRQLSVLSLSALEPFDTSQISRASSKYSAILIYLRLDFVYPVYNV